MSFEVVAELLIDAPPRLVWRALTEVDRWAEWCTWLRWEGGGMVVGERISLRLTPPQGAGYAFQPEVLLAEPDRHLAWVGRTLTPGVFDGEHHFVLEAVGEGQTQLINRERYSGLLSPILRHLPAMQSAEAGFVAMNEEIRARAEALAREAPNTPPSGGAPM